MSSRAKALLFLATAALIAVASSPVASQTVSWSEAIARVEASAETYRTYAHERGVSQAGSVFNEWHLARHTCAILGRMLGHVEAIRHLEEMDYPPLLKNSDAIYSHSMLVFSISLENWVNVARRAVAASRVERINTWNLFCAGYMDIPRVLAIPSPRPEADFIREGSRLRVLGDIDAGFAERFREALEANPGIDEILLGSSGGSIADAVAAGRMIRARGLKTTLYYNCYSACTLVFLGGADRVVWADGSRFGLHMVSRGGMTIPIDDPIYRLMSAYIAEMGGDPVRIVAWMLLASPAGMSYPEPADYCDLGLATWVQRTCDASWNGAGR